MYEAVCFKGLSLGLEGRKPCDIHFGSGVNPNFYSSVSSLVNLAEYYFPSTEESGEFLSSVFIT